MALPDGYNWFLIILTIALSLVLVAANVYILIHYQHPDDVNQAWFPKIVVVMSLWLAMAMVLLFPLDVANRAACNFSIVESSCKYALPMQKMWQAAFISNLVLTFFFIPFTMFYYEGDSDYSCGLRIKNALLWTLAMAVVLGLAIGVAYGLAGYVEYPTQELLSGMLPLEQLPQLPNTTGRCILPGQGFAGFSAANIARKDGCTAFNSAFYGATWTMRVSFPVYIMAIQSVIGWILFLVFAGWGIFAAPIDWIFQYIRRPKAVITKSEYIERARGLAMRAKDIKVTAEMLKRQKREVGRNRHWRSNFKQLQRQLIQLEEDEVVLDSVFPQGQDGEVRWVMYQLGYIGTGLMGLIGLCVSGCWLAHIIVYMLPPIPIHPLLNEVFIKLDGVFPLFGVAAFAAFCGYLLIVAIKGNFLLGLNFLVISLYPIRVGATLMSSFLVNTALILAMSSAVIQFCASAFASYANSTQIFDVFGNQVMYLKGLRYIYQFNIFLYMFMGIMGISIIVMVIKGPGKWKRAQREDAYKF
ncbi:hypothetical protein OEZ86_006379 [Tetradesmus obliquus]|nr:hypothetical protein OEZ86_006379 [Tetradesmus obliquus]